MSGWVKLYRKLWDWPYSSKPDYVAVWVYLLTHAAHQEHDTIFNGLRITISKGQLVAGRKVISEKTGVSESKVQRILKCLENEQQIEQQTHPCGRLISLPRWDCYQESEQPNEQQMNNKRTTSEQQVNTIQELKKDKKVKNTTPLNPLKGKRSPKKTALPTIPSELNQPVFTTAWQEWIQHRSELKKRLTPSTATKQLQMLLPMGADHAAAVLNHSITKGWQGLFPDDVPAPVTPTEPEPAVEYFEPIGWQKFANEYAEAIRIQIFNKGEGKWENLTPAQQQDLTEKCKEL